MGKSRVLTLALFLIAAAALLIQASPAPAADFPAAPMLRVETGMHNGPVSSIATDGSNRYLVTGGPDKTVRLWSLPELDLLKTFRPPIGKGPEGYVTSVAMSPDGTRIAVGGEFCKPYEGWHGAFIFETASGRIVKRLAGFDARMSVLDWSPDGALLAAGMRGRGGLRLFRTSDWSEVGRDKDYGSFIAALHFDGRGRLATTSWDGKIRLYEADQKGLKLIRSKTASSIEHPQFRGRKSQNQGRPFALRFSPDGSKLAVGHKVGSNWVIVLSSDTLEPMHAASTEKFHFGIHRLAWSPDGTTLYACGGSAEIKPQFIRKWSDGGRGNFTDLPAGTHTLVTGLLSLKDGGVAFSTYSSELGRYDHTGARTAYLTARSANFYDSTEQFKVSKDGARIEFAYDGNGRGILNFDLRARRLASGASTDESMAAPVVNAGSLRFYKSWQNTRGALEIGNKKLAMGHLEVSRSLAISPDRSSVVAGTDAFLRLYSKDGARLWAVPIGALAVNVSGDGRLVVAAAPQGGIHWYRRSDGRLLLSLFVASDKKRWVLVSPSGFYDTSVGGEELVGWHVNRGREEAADFFPVSRTRARFYRPEVIAGILDKADDADALKLAAKALGGSAPVVLSEAKSSPSRSATAATPPSPAPKPQIPASPEPTTSQAEAGGELTDAAEAATEEETAAQVVTDVTRVLPPVVTILAPASGTVISSNTATVRYTVRSSPDAPITSVRSRVNGLGQDTRDLKVVARDDVRELTVTVPSEDCEIVLYAQNRHGISAPATIRLYWRGAKPSEIAKPVLYVLAVGVSKYRKPEYRLNFAAKDAVDFVGIVKQQKGKHYSDVVVKSLADEAAGNAAVMEGFDWLQQQVTPRDVGMVFIAGHGVTDERGDYFFLPFNADLDDLAKTAVPFNEIKSRLANLRGKGLLFVDTCHSGNIMGSRKGLSSDVTGLLNELSGVEYSLVVLASSTGRQASLENERWGNGAFTKALVEGLAGQADLKRRGRITHKMLDFYVSDRVEELTKGRQTPVNASPQGVPDFTIAIVTVPAS